MTTPSDQDTHVSTDWEIRKTSDNELVYSSLNDTINLTSISIPVGILMPNTSYEFRARHRGAIYNSAYGSTTAATLIVFQDMLFEPANLVNSEGGAVQGGRTLAPISSTKAVKIYARGAGSGSELYGVVVTTNGTTVTYGEPTLLSASYSLYASVDTLSSTSGVVVYRDATQFVRAVAFTISGDAITAGISVPIQNITSTANNIAAISSTACVAVWDAAGNGVYRGVVLTVSGLNITVGVINASLSNTTAGVISLGLAASGPNLVVFSYYVAANLGVQSITVSGSGAAATLTSNAVFTTNTGNGTGLNSSLAVLSPNSFVVVYNQNPAGSGIATLFSISGTTVTRVSDSTLQAAGSPLALSVSALTSTSLVVSYYQSGTEQAIARTVDVSGTALLVNAVSILVAGPGSQIRHHSVVSLQAPAIAQPSAVRALVGYNADQTVEYAHPIGLNGNGVVPGIAKSVFEYARPIVVVNALFQAPFRACSMSSTRAIHLSVEYKDDARNGVLTARLVDTTSNIFMQLAAVEIANAFQTEFSICALSSSSALIFYRRLADGFGAARAITVIGEMITVGAEFVVNSSSTTYQSLAALTSTSAVAFYKAVTGGNLVSVLTVTGNTVTAGVGATVTGQGADYFSVASITPTSAIVFYRENTTASKASLLTISGTTITVGAPVTVTTGNFLNCAIAALSSTRVVVSDANTTSVNFRTLDIVGTAIQVNAAASLTATTLYAPGLCALEPTVALTQLNVSTPASGPVYTLSVSAAGLITFGTVNNAVSGLAAAPYPALTTLTPVNVGSPNSRNAALFYRSSGANKSGFYEMRKFTKASGN